MELLLIDAVQHICQCHFSSPTARITFNDERNYCGKQWNQPLLVSRSEPLSIQQFDLS